MLTLFVEDMNSKMLKDLILLYQLNVFEHDEFWKDTIMNCITLTKPGGIFLFSCATTGRQEHGTRRTTPQDSPFTSLIENDYYMNLTEKRYCRCN